MSEPKQQALASKPTSNEVVVVAQLDSSALVRRNNVFRVISEGEHFAQASSPHDPLPKLFDMPSSAWDKLLKPHDWAKALNFPSALSAQINIEFWRRGCIGSEDVPSDEIVGFTTRYVARYISDTLHSK